MIKDPAPNKQQAQIIKDFRDTTQASAKQAFQFLSRAKWNIQNAINIFFDQGAVPEEEPLLSTKKIEDLFEELTPSTKHQGIRYMDEQKFTIFNERYFKFADNNVVLGYILVIIMDAPTSGYIQYKHFVKLFQYLNVTDPIDLHKYSTKLQVQLRNNKQAYREMYRKMYRFYLFVNKEHSLDYEIAEQLWKMYLKPIMPLYNKFIQYLQSLTKKPMKVHRDLWNMVYQFATTIKDVKQVNQSDGWPVFLDQFVEYCKQQ